MKTVRSLWLPFAYYFSWALFGLGGLLLNIGCAPLLLARNRERFGGPARAATRALLGLWLRWMRFSGVVEVTWIGFDRPLPPGAVYVANHPTLVDAPFLLARLPDTVCIFKPALLRNPFIAPTALLCGYVPGARGVDLVRNSVQRLSAGQSLLIFPEGTRTPPGAALHPLKPGFALIARRAGVPIQLIRVRSGPLMGCKGLPWWKLPPLPGRFEFTLDELIPAGGPVFPTELTERVAARLQPASVPSGS